MLTRLRNPCQSHPLYLLIMTILVVWIAKLTFFSEPSLMSRAPVQLAPHMDQLNQQILPRKSTTVKSSRVKILYSQYINGTKASLKNVYITEKGYTSRATPKYFNDPVSSLWQLTTYMSAGELARRYNAKYIIDVGCGSGSKLAAFEKEFHLIGVDYKGNLENVRSNFPYINVVEVNLDKGSSCQINISPVVLSQAIVISADVIEHLVDPFACYMKVLQQLANQTMAVVLSTPDRYALNTKHNNGVLVGPPLNPSHIREWLVEELDIMFMDYGMFPVARGLECEHGGTCTSGYLPKNNPHSTAVLFIPNTQVTRMWLSETEDDMVVYAYLIVQEGINENLLEFNIQYLQQQGIQVCLVAVEPWVAERGWKLPTLKAASGGDIGQVVGDAINKDSFKPDDWIMVINANEVLSIPNYSALSHSLRDTLFHIGHEPFGFNAVAVSTLFMHDSDGKSYSDLPFKIFGLQPWTTGGKDSLKNMRPPGDTQKLSTRIWKRGLYSARLTMCDTLSHHVVPCDVEFVGKKAHPYRAQSLRFHPSVGKPYIQLPTELQKMYVLEIALGYYESTRNYIMTADYLY